MLILQFVKLILKLRIVIFKKRNILSKLFITGIGTGQPIAFLVLNIIFFFAFLRLYKNLHILMFIFYCKIYFSERRILFNY